MGGVRVLVDKDGRARFLSLARGGVRAIVRDHEHVVTVPGVILGRKEVLDGLPDHGLFVTGADDKGDFGEVLALLEMLLGQPKEKDHDELE